MFKPKIFLPSVGDFIEEYEVLGKLGEGSFEFERTASRICEMQSEDWGFQR